jgi:hypothetical protein
MGTLIRSSACRPICFIPPASRCAFWCSKNARSRTMCSSSTPASTSRKTNARTACGTKTLKKFLRPTNSVRKSSVIQNESRWSGFKRKVCNLNISRYISTAIAESEMDLAATHGILEIIENAIQKATIKHNEFLEELGLPPLPSPHSNSFTAIDPSAKRERKFSPGT